MLFNVDDFTDGKFVVYHQNCGFWNGKGWTKDPKLAIVWESHNDAYRAIAYTKCRDNIAHKGYIKGFVDIIPLNKARQLLVAV